MKEDLKIAIIQSELVWENPAQNRLDFSKKINLITEAVDLIILPEMFTTGFTMNATDIAETMDGETIIWLKDIAKVKNTAISGSLIIKENNNYYNRLVFVHPTGEINTYNKRHTFTLAGEDKVYTSGNKKLIVNYKGWKICPMICYDLRFPVWSRNANEYDLLFFVANWPKPRITAWNTLLKARAIENMCYTIGVNRIGSDDNGHQYSGNSGVYDALGEEISTINPHENTTEVVSISMDKLTKTRKKFGFLEDRDAFRVTNVEQI